MKKAIIITAIVILAIIFISLQGTKDDAPVKRDNASSNPIAGDVEDNAIAIDPISHATFVLTWGQVAIYNDPVGGAESFIGREKPELILLSDIHGDHLDVPTLESIITASTTVIAPQAVFDELSDTLKNQTTVLANDETTMFEAITITAVPMYNLPADDPESRHTKGRGNGYILEKNGYKIYIAGDTAGTPEMRALTDIGLAFIPMNLPYTMSVEEAADAVLEFQPLVVYPYHYRGTDGVSDIGKFKTLVQEKDPSIDVVLLNWYVQQ